MYRARRETGLIMVYIELARREVSSGYFTLETAAYSTMIVSLLLLKLIHDYVGVHFAGIYANLSRGLLTNPCQGHDEILLGSEVGHGEGEGKLEKRHRTTARHNPDPKPPTQTRDQVALRLRKTPKMNDTGIELWHSRPIE